MPDALLSEIRVANFRSARRLTLRPGPICAFIGEPGAGKSNVLFALRALLDPGFDLSTADVTVGQRALSIEATLADGRTVSLGDRTGAPPIVHFPTTLRGSDLVSGSVDSSAAEAIHGVIHEALARAPAPRVALIRGLEACAPDFSGVVFAIEEPELFPPRTRTGISVGSSNASRKAEIRSSSPRTRRVCSASPRSTKSTSSPVTSSA